jgi:DNA uptake protein ComE-like DNA-binding protein
MTQTSESGIRVPAPTNKVDDVATTEAGTESSAADIFDSSPASAIKPTRRKATISDRITWTYRQRRAMAVVLVVVLAVLVWRSFSNPAFIPKPQPTTPLRSSELADRLDPNTANWQELVAIPTLGEKRAQAIVDYRQDWQKRHPGVPAYLVPTDLAAVKGIGGSMIQAISPFLLFPSPPATQSAP